MTNPTIYVNLSSLDEGTVPTVSDSIEVAEGGLLDVSVTWPSNSSIDTIQCSLDFSGTDQDPFNDETGGVTSFAMTRTSSTVAAVETLGVESDALVGTDTYDLTLSINGVTYTKDPRIDVNTKPPPPSA